MSDNIATSQCPVCRKFLMECSCATASSRADWAEKYNQSTPQRWLKPSEVTEPGLYWMVDADFPELPLRVASITRGRSGILYGQYTGDYFRYYGPIQPPEYKGE